MVTSAAYRHVPTRTLAVLAQRLGTVCASPSTWYRLVRRRMATPARLRVHPSKPKVGVRTTRPDEMWHIDTTVNRLLDGTRAYVHAVIDNFPRRILEWNVSSAFLPGNSVAGLLAATQRVTVSQGVPVVLADAGVENVNAQIDALLATGVLRHLLAMTEPKFSNSMIEAWWRSLKHHWLFLHALESVATVRRLVAFYVDEHNRVLPHSAFRGQTARRGTSGRGRRLLSNSRHARAPRGELACKPTNRRPANVFTPSNGVSSRRSAPGRRARVTRTRAEKCRMSWHAARLRDECLNVHQFVDLADARTWIEAWREDYQRRLSDRTRPNVSWMNVGGAGLAARGGDRCRCGQIRRGTGEARRGKGLSRVRERALC